MGAQGPRGVGHGLQRLGLATTRIQIFADQLPVPTTIRLCSYEEGRAVVKLQAGECE